MCIASALHARISASLPSHIFDTPRFVSAYAARTSYLSATSVSKRQQRPRFPRHEYFHLRRISVFSYLYLKLNCWRAILEMRTCRTLLSLCWLHPFSAFLKKIAHTQPTSKDRALCILHTNMARTEACTNTIACPPARTKCMSPGSGEDRRARPLRHENQGPD